MKTKIKKKVGLFLVVFFSCLIYVKGQVTTQAAINITDTSATFKGTLVSGGRDTDQFDIHFFYGTNNNDVINSTNGAQQSVTSVLVGTISGSNKPNDVSKSLTNLLPGTTYYFRLAVIRNSTTNYATGQVLSFTTTGTPLSINQEIEENKNNVYPNPTTTIINVKGKAQIFDLLGNQVTEGENEINIKYLSKGIYIVKTNLGTVKLIKE